MEYQTGRIGRVVVAKGSTGEDVYSEIEAIAAKENIRCGMVMILGGLKHAKVVVGPKTLDGPIDPIFTEFDDGREVLGVGTIFCDEEGPKLHLHAGIGRNKEAIVGCPRGGASVFCVLEVIIFEIDGVDASRRLDPELGLKLLTLGAS